MEKKKKWNLNEKRKREREKITEYIQRLITDRRKTTLQMEKVNEKLDCLCAFSYEIT